MMKSNTSTKIVLGCWFFYAGLLLVYIEIIAFGGINVDEPTNKQGCGFIKAAIKYSTPVPIRIFTNQCRVFNRRIYSLNKMSEVSRENPDRFITGAPRIPLNRSRA